MEAIRRGLRLCERCGIEWEGQILIPANGDHAMKARAAETGPVLAAFTLDNAEYAKPQDSLVNHSRKPEYQFKFDGNTSSYCLRSNNVLLLA